MAKFVIDQVLFRADARTGVAQQFAPRSPDPYRSKVFLGPCQSTAQAKYIPIGGVVIVDLIELPAESRTVKRWTLRTLSTHELAPRKLSYPLQGANPPVTPPLRLLPFL